MDFDFDIFSYCYVEDEQLRWSAGEVYIFILKLNSPKVMTKIRDTKT